VPSSLRSAIVRGFFPCLLVLVLGACGSDPPPSLFVQHGPDATGLGFVNAIEGDTATYSPIEYYYLFNGAGVAVGDVTGDSLPDLYFSGNQVDGRLYRNEGDLRFTDVTAGSGIDHDSWATGVTFADVNGDGHLDLYVCRAGPHPPERRANLLYVNDGDGTFTERADEFGIADTSASTHAVFFDYDKDGDLDLFLANHSNAVSEPNHIRPIVTDGTGKGNDRLYRNDDSTFTDVTVEAGIVYPGMTLGVAVNDINGDGWEDIYVSNDFLAHDYLYVNDGDGTFTERGTDVLKHHSYAAMGTDMGDVNNDGRVDIVTVDMWPPDNEARKRMSIPMSQETFRRMLDAGYHPQYWRNTLQINNGLNVNGTLSFSDVGHYAGIEATGWSWAPLLADFDQDGRRDLWITNGYRRAMIDMDFLSDSYRFEQRYGNEGGKTKIEQRANTDLYTLKRVDQVFRNTGGYSFEPVSEKWGVTDESFSNGAAYADLDSDGDLDMVVNRIDQPVGLYENTASDSSFLKVRLRGAGDNTRGLGASLRLYCDDRLQRRHHTVSRGYQSSVGYPVHFGLGTCTVADSLRVRWPDGATQLLTDVDAGQTLTLRRRAARPGTATPPSLPTDRLLTPARTETDLTHRHDEEPFNDFKRQRLLPHKHSRTGPGIAVGDVNGDGLEDAVIGGSFRQSTRLLLQRRDGTFDERALGTEPYYPEDTAVLLFDADGDGDLDLYLGAGSSEFPSDSEHLQDRLYLNDGTGSFTLAPDALPDLTSSTGSVTAADYDEDGDLDLFVGGRLRPGEYPLSPRSYLLRNDDGQFVDVTQSAAPPLQRVGMVTSALWTDFNTDGRVDLLVTGEFMPIRFFENTDSGFRDVTDQTGLPNMTGWWNSITGGDFDRDGDTDYVVGNLGLNTRYEASPSQPVSLYAGDFDHNRHVDPILTHYVQGTEVPIHRRNELLTQLPGLRKTFPDYESYATATLSDLLSKEQREEARTFRATRFESTYLENRGDGRFRARALPTSAQLAPLYGLLTTDVTGDGYLDVLTVGNSYAPDVLTGRHDAFVGLLLRGDGTGDFEAVSHRESGFFVDGDGTGLVRLHAPDGRPLYLAGQNDDSTHVFRQTEASPLRTIRPGPQAAYAEVRFEDGTVQRRELYYGSGYLSQSSRRLLLPPNAESVTLHTYDGTTRTGDVVSPGE